MWSAFPTINPLSGVFSHFYDWPVVNDGWDLLDLLAVQEPHVTISPASAPPSQDTLSTDDTVQYIAALTNHEARDVQGVQLWLTGSDGLSYQSVAGATCANCAASDRWLLNAPDMDGGATYLLTATALLDSDLGGLSAITTTTCC